MADLQTTAGPSSGGTADILIPNVISKRQRRPSVRLGEIGDQSAALSHDSYMRRNRQWRTLEEKQWKAVQEEAKSPLQQQAPIGSSKNASDLGISNKMSKTRPLLNIGNGSNHESQGQGLGLGLGQGQGQGQGQMQVRHEDPAAGQSVAPEEGQLQVVELIGGQINGKNMQFKSRNVGKKGRHGKGRRGGTRGAGVVGKFMTRTIRVSPEAEDNEKGSGEEGFGEPLSNASYDIDTPEGFRDFDLETSDSPGDTKETSALQVDSPENTLINLGPSECHQIVGEVYGNERDGFISEQRDRGKSAETWPANTKDRALSLEYMDGNGLEIPSDTEARSKQDANDFLVREPKCEADKEASVPMDARHRAAQETNVRTWLNGLGLGRYAPLFEMHEVDGEVLPMLTLEDLRDMGINAVGSRRKMYNAIQKLGKSFAM